MQASAGFVSASALGMACGPALACLFQTNFKIYKFTFNEDTLPGWVMALLWLVYLLWLWFSFREPLIETKKNLVPQEANAGLSIRLRTIVHFALKCSFLLLVFLAFLSVQHEFLSALITHTHYLISNQLAILHSCPRYHLYLFTPNNKS